MMCHSGAAHGPARAFSYRSPAPPIAAAIRRQLPQGEEDEQRHGPEEESEEEAGKDDEGEEDREAGEERQNGVNKVNLYSLPPSIRFVGRVGSAFSHKPTG